MLARGKLAGGKAARWPIGFSIGLVTCDRPSGAIQALVREADELVYQVKRSGKNRIEARVLNHHQDRPQS